MSDPMNTRPVPPPENPPPGGRPPDDPPPTDEPRRSPSPLIWILILIALIALGWYFYNQRSAPDLIDDMSPPAATGDAMTPADSDSVETGPDPDPAPAPDPEPVAEPASSPAALIEQPELEYPREAFRAREEGTVLVEAQIDAMGNASEVTVVERSGSRTLDRAAVDEVRRWKFSPAMQNGQAVASSIQVPVEYSLEEADAQ